MRRDMDAEMKAWAAWRSSDSGLDIGYPSQSAFATQIKSTGQANVPLPGINDQHAMAIDGALSRLRLTDDQAARLDDYRYVVAIDHYLMNMSRARIAKRLRIDRNRVASAIKACLSFVEGKTDLDTKPDSS